MDKKILIIDDDPAFRDSVESVLEAKGYKVFTAQTGEEGFEKAKALKPDLITLDIMMEHDSKGLEVSKMFSADQEVKNIPVIMISGIRKASNLTMDYATGQNVLNVRTVLEKPIKPGDLLKVIADNLK